jgi:hypothetical protein
MCPIFAVRRGTKQTIARHGKSRKPIRSFRPESRKGRQNDLQQRLGTAIVFALERAHIYAHRFQSGNAERTRETRKSAFCEAKSMRNASRIRRILIGILICWVISFTMARGQSLTSAPQPPAEIQSLEKALVGKWSTTYDFEPGGTSPNGGTGTGEEVWRPGPGGYVLMEEEHVHGPFGEVFLFALHWWDKSTNSLRGMLCNNSGPAACNVDSYFNTSLKWDGNQLAIDMQFPQNGKKMLWHEVWSGITATSFTQTGDMGEVGGPLKRAVTIHGTKVAVR